MIRLVTAAFAILLGSPGAVLSEPAWYACTAWGSSHTAHYTFLIGTEPCSIYWKEIDKQLAIAECQPPRIVATKPFSVSNGYVLEFDLAAGRFEDFTPMWSDRGRCTRLPEGRPAPNSP